MARFVNDEFSKGYALGLSDGHNGRLSCGCYYRCDGHREDLFPPIKPDPLPEPLLPMHHSRCGTFLSDDLLRWRRVP